MKIDSKTYDLLKWVASLLLPAIGTLYFALAQIWGFPCAEQVLGTITAIDTFLGVILGLSSNAYSGDGTLNIDTSNPDKDVYRLSVNCPIEDLKYKKMFTVKVNPTATLNNEE